MEQPAIFYSDILKYAIGGKNMRHIGVDLHTNSFTACYLQAVVLKVNRKIDVAVNKYLKFVWTYLFTATLILDKSRIRTIFLSEHSTISY
ncbi:hypothetical protein [Wolbachia endosymbiont (group A) of Anomoia purmunda]|uniref:hypothetical protein n=1 Tax=Wolbachia endosymbiont (group A) of Anomoia purmunda TaxID=2953978 RepID=UPI00222F924D|nr:hypothetical protein [Wolbachia endosymbiont (group A) of Anomoia purmunda]